MPDCPLSENEIVLGLRSEEESVRTRTSNCIYHDAQVNRSVKGYVIKREGSLEQAQAVFDYAFLTFEKKVRTGKYPNVSLAENNWRKYLAGIGYFAWDKRKYGQTDLPSFDEWKDSYDPIAPISEEDYPPKIEHILSMLDECGPNCRFIFEKNELEDYDLKETAKLLTEKLGRPISHDNVRQQKYNCLNRLRERL